ncbi:ATP-binding protein [Kineococcus sp. SYSU DK004]|uniref:ATP-binding protein n=1 Tax=Kineococcus sp. SYSU DK004 TaxID=3383125 RepID=UPI003D7DC355
MSARGVRRLVALVVAVALVSISPTVATDLLARTTTEPAWWSATAVAAHLGLVAALARAAWTGEGLRGACWAVVVTGNALVLGHAVLAPPAAGRAPAPWELALSPATVGAAAVVLPLGPALVAGLVHIAVRGVLPLSGTWRQPPLEAVLDGLLLLVIVAAASVAVQAVRAAADQVATARTQADAAAARAAAAAAAEREHARWDAIVHDDVLAVLSVAAAARTGEDRAVAGDAARTALRRLGRDVAPAPVPLAGPAGLAGRLAEAAHRRAPGAVVEVGALAAAPASARLAADVADALADATAEAVRNAVRHGGGPGGPVPLTTVAAAVVDDVVVVEVRDEGVGFDPAAVAGGRLGLSVSVGRRVEAVGGRAQVLSAPGRGTRVVLRAPLATAGGGAP